MARIQHKLEIEKSTVTISNSKKVNIKIKIRKYYKKGVAYEKNIANYSFSYIFFNNF